jgi:hypothetical protein
VPSENPLIVQPIQIHPRSLAPYGPPTLLEAGNSAWLLFNRAALRPHGMGCAAGLTLQDAGRRATYRTTALSATAAIAMASSGYAAFTEAAARESAARADTGEMIAQHFDAMAKDSERMTPTAELDAEQLRAAVQTRDRLLNRNIDAEGMLQVVSVALAPFPELDIDLLEWSYGAPAASATPSPASLKSILIRVGGHVNTQLPKAKANAAVAAFAAAMGRQLGGADNVEKLPFDVGPEGSLTSKPHDDAASPPQFIVNATIPAGTKP